MGKQVCMGATMQCTFGVTPSSLVVLPTHSVTTNHMPDANIMDHKPMVNILPFGMCSSMANPTVAAATIAASGTLTPMPCTPVVSAPWTPGNPTVMIGKLPIINNTSQCFCAFGGAISFTDAGQHTVED